jgi:hypothetical protein
MRASLMIGVSLIIFTVFNAPAHAYLFADEDEVQGDANGSQIDSSSFFQSIKGRYSVVMAGGTPPHGNDIGTVEIEDQVVLTFGYCPPGAGCDPGYIFLEWSKTKVFQNGGEYTITSEADGKKVKYTWTVTADKISFKNYQYVMPNNSVVTLEHVLRKM